MRLYHVTTQDKAALIQARGFQDPPGTIGVMMEEAVWRPYRVRGLFFCDYTSLQRSNNVPHDVAAILRLEVPDDLIREFEIVEDEADGDYREWCLPADLANRFFTDRAIFSWQDLLRLA